MCLKAKAITSAALVTSPEVVLSASSHLHPAVSTASPSFSCGTSPSRAQCRTAGGSTAIIVVDTPDCCRLRVRRVHPGGGGQRRQDPPARPLLRHGGRGRAALRTGQAENILLVLPLRRNITTINIIKKSSFNIHAWWSRQQCCIVVPLPSVALAGTVSGSGSERNVRVPAGGQYSVFSRQ